MRSMLDYYSGVANKPQSYGSDMYNDAVDVVPAETQPLIETGKDEADNPIMTTPLAQQQFGVEQMQEEKSGLTNAKDWIAKTGNEISGSGVLETLENVSKKANPMIRIGNYLTNPESARQDFKDFVRYLPDTTRTRIEHNSLYESYVFTPEERNQEINRMSKLLGFNVTPYANDREVWTKLALAANQVERVSKFKEFQDPQGNIDINKVYEKFPWLSELQKAQGTAAAAMVLANIDGVKTISDVYEDNEIFKLFGSGWTGVRRAVNTMEKSARLLPALIGRRMPTEAEQKKIDEIDKILGSLPNYSYDSLFGIVGGLAGNVAEQGNLLLSSLAAKTAVAKGLSGASARSQFAYGTLLSTLLMTMQTSPLNYSDLITETDADGKQKYKPSAAAPMAWIGGVVESAIEEKSIGTQLNTFFSKSAAPALASIITKSESLEAFRKSAMSYLKTRAKEMTKNALVRGGAELEEEFEQGFFDRVIKNLAEIFIRGEKADVKSVEQILMESYGDALEAIPAVAGFAASGIVGSPIANTRAALRFRHMVRNEAARKNAENRFANAHYVGILSDIWAKKDSIKELQNKSPETVQTMYDAQNKQAGIEYGFVDVKTLSQQEGGQALVQEIAERNNISADDLAACMDGSGMLQVKTSTLMQMDLKDEQHQAIKQNVTTSLEAFTEAQQKSALELARESLKDVMDFTDKTYKKSIDSIIAARFPNANQAALAREIIEANYDNPQAEWKRRLDAVNAEIQEEIDPIVRELKSGMKQGTTLVRDSEGNPTGARISNNDSWYSNYFADYGRAPSEGWIIDNAIDIASGRQNPRYGLPDYQNNTDESRAYYAGVAEKLDKLKEERDALQEIGDRMKALKPGEMVATATLDSSALKVYDSLISQLGKSKNKKVQKAAKLNALMFARFAQNMAKVISRVKQKPYTAEDFVRERFKVDANAEYNEKLEDAAQMFQVSPAEFERQKAEVRKRYEGTDQWMKAPNGNPTNLTEDQWVTVRTPAFKNWFGHWDLAAERAKLDKAVPVPVQENRVGATETEKPIANAIRQFNEMYPDGEVVPTVIGDVKINEESVSDSLSHKFSQAKLDAVLSLVEGMKTASYMGQMKDPTNKAKTNHYFVYKIKYGDGTRYVFVRGVQNFNNPAKLYVHEVYDEESIKKRSETISWPPDHEDQVQSRGIALYTSILNAFLNNVNSSKVVDENGEPLVVYHGTKKKFDTFEKQKIGTGVSKKTKGGNHFGSGFYFTPTYFDAQKFGRNVLEVFLSIKNPASSEYGLKEDSDGIIASGFNGREYVAFEPTQIKDATGHNVGFDPQSGNIYLQEAQTQSDAEMQEETIDKDGIQNRWLDLNNKEEIKKLSDSLTKDNIPTTEIEKTLISSYENISSEEQLQKCQSFVEELTKADLVDPLGNKVYFKPGNGEDLRTYTFHLIAGEEAALNNDLSKIRIKRILGVHLAPETIKNPLLIIKQKSNGRRMYVSMYKSDIQYANSIVVGVEDGQKGRVVTVTIAGKKEDKKTALRELKKRMSGENTDKVLYIREGLSGYSRPTSGNRTSTDSTTLRPSGNQIISQENNNSNTNPQNYNYDALYQIHQSTAKGSIGETMDGQRLIRLFETADQSTFMHEMAHMFLLELQDIAALDPESREAKDLATIIKWAEYKPGQSEECKGTASAEEFRRREEAIKAAEKAGDTAEAARLKNVWLQERFARGFEEYLRSGEAPATGLQKAFRQFKKWLKEIYTDVTGAGVRATPEVEAIMARIIASEDEIDALAAANNVARFRKIDPDILETDIGKLYEQWQEEAKEKAKEKLLKELMKEYEENNLKDIAKRLEEFKESARKELQNTPCFVCEELLKDGTDMESALEICGFASEQEYRTALMFAGGSLENALNEMTERAKENMLNKMPSGDKLYEMAEDALLSGDYNTRLAELEAEIMKARETEYDKIPAKLKKAFKELDEAAKNFEAEGVRAAVLKLKYAERWGAIDFETIKELEGYLARLEKQDADKDKIKTAFEKKYNELKQRTIRNENWVRGVRDAVKGEVAAIKKLAETRMADEQVSAATNPRYWHRQELKEGKAAWDLISKAQRADTEKGEINYNDAVNAKRQQAYFAALTTMAVENRKKLDKMMNGKFGFLARAKRMADPKVKADPNMRYYYSHLMYIFGIRNSDGIPPTNLKSITEVLAELRASHQFEDEVPAWLIAAADTKEQGKNYQQLTMGQLEELKKFTDILYTLARNQNSLLTMDVDMETVQADCTVDYLNNVDYQVGQQRINEITGAIGSYMNSLLKSERFLALLGGEHGAHIRYIYRTLFTASENEEKMQEQEAEALKELYGKYYTRQELRAILNDNIPGLSIGADTNITKENLICMALNMGNETNRARLAMGLYNCQSEAERLRREMELMQMLQENLTEKDWQFVQAMWDHIDSFANPVSRVLEKCLGVPLKRVKAQAFEVQLPDGKILKMSGGYYPIVKDSSKSTRQSEFEQMEEAKAVGGISVLGAGMGSTKDRAENLKLKQGPLRLTLDVAHRHIDAQIHLITMRMAVRDAYKVLNSEAVRGQIENTFGQDTMKSLNEWVFNCWAPPIRPVNRAEQIAANLRSGSISAIMAYRVSTALLNLANIVYMTNEIGPVNAIKAVGDYYRHPRENREAIMAVSVYMRNRAANMDRDLRAQEERILNRHEGLMGKAGNAIDKATGGTSEEVRYLIDKYSNRLIEETDMLFSLPLYHWQFTETYNTELAKGVSEEEARETANYEATRRVTKVFPSSRKIDSSEVQRSRSEFVKLLTPFFSFANTVMNAVWSKYYEGKYNGRVPLEDASGNIVRNENGDIVYTSAKKGFIRRYGRFVVAALMDYLVGAFFETWLRQLPDVLAGGGGDDDDDLFGVGPFKVNTKKFATSALDSVTGGFYGVNAMLDAERVYAAFVEGKGVYGGGRNIGVLSGTAQRGLKVVEDVGKLLHGSEKIDMLDFMRDMAKASNAKTGFSDTLTDAFFNTARFATDEGYSLDNMDDLREYIAKTIFDRRLKKK